MQERARKSKKPRKTRWVKIIRITLTVLGDYEFQFDSNQGLRHSESAMKDQPDLKAVNKWVTDKRMLALMDLAEKVLKTPIKGLSIDTSLQPGDADVIGLMLLKGQIEDESKGKLIFTDATTDALKDAAKTWFLNYLKHKEPNE